MNQTGYAEIQSIERFPNFRNAAILGYCLNISGLQVGSHKKDDGEYAFRKVVIAWTKRNYLWLVKKNPKVAKAILVGKLSFDARKKQLVKTYEKGLNQKAPQQGPLILPAIKWALKEICIVSVNSLPMAHR
jgi:hypothetical protein